MSDQPEPTRSSATRRNFVKIALRDAVGTASQLAGLGGVVATTAAEAGRAMQESLAGLGEDAAPRRTAPAAPVVPAAAHPSADAPVLTSETLPAQAASLLEGVHVGVLATLAADGSPLLASGPMRYDGSAFVTAGRDLSAKVSNARRDPRVSLVISDAAGDALHVSGRAVVRSGPEAVELARLLYEDAGGSVPEGWGSPDDRGEVVLLAVEPLRAFWRRRAAPL